MKPLIFNFYEIVRLEVFSDDKRVNEFYIGEYKKHLDRVGLPFHSVVRLNLNPANIKKLRRVQHKILARWRYWVEIDENEVEINATGNYFAIPMIHHMLVHHSLRYLASINGVMMLHSGAVSREGKSVIFSGKGGTGKTTTTAILLSDIDAGWQVHADDYAFISAEPKSFAYMTRQHLYLPLLKWVPQLRHAMTVKERFALILLGKIRQWTRDGLKWPVRMDAERAWGKDRLCFEATPSGLVLLRRSKQSQATKILIDNNVDDAVTELLEMNFSEAHHFIELVSAINPDFDNILLRWKQRESELLRQFISKTPLYELYLPNQSDDFRKSSNEVSSLVMSILDSSN